MQCAKISVTWTKWKAIYTVVPLSQFFSSPSYSVFKRCNTFVVTFFFFFAGFFFAPKDTCRTSAKSCWVRGHCSEGMDNYGPKTISPECSSMHIHRNMNSGMGTWHMKMYNFGLPGLLGHFNLKLRNCQFVGRQWEKKYISTYIRNEKGIVFGRTIWILVAGIWIS